MQCNLCVTGLDESLTSEDLHLIFSKFGEIKSCKVAQDPVSGKSRGYGYVWFFQEKASSAALAATNDLPYQVKLFKPMCLRECESKATMKNTVMISGYPKDFDEAKLKDLIGKDLI